MSNKNVKNPEIKKVYPKWERVRVLSEECEEEYANDSYFITLPNESKQGKKDRTPAYLIGFANFAGSLLRIKGDTVYQKQVQRDKLSTMQEAFVKTADRSGQSFQEMMQNEVAPCLSGYGTVFAVIDKPAVETVNAADEEKRGIPYLTVLSPFQVVDFEWGSDGRLLWFQYTITTDDARTPDAATVRAKDREKIVTWTRDEYIVKGSGAAEKTPNPFGFVPVVIQAQFVDPDKTIGKSSFFATSRYIFAGNNLACASNYEVFKNSSATLLMDVQDYEEEETQKDARSEDTNLRKLTKQTDEYKNVFLYSKTAPTYLARDLELITSAAARAKAYFDLALENEKSALSVNTAQTAESGVAKAYEFTSINGVLSAFARALQHFEYHALKMVADMTAQQSEFTVTYPQDFDVRSFDQKLAYMEGLLKVRFPSETGIREAYKSLTPDITENAEKQAAINTEVDGADVKAIEKTNQTTPPNGGNQGA